jgi:uncharacterized protein (TIGR03435 family)
MIKTFLAGIALLAASAVVTSRAQSTAAPDWQAAAGGKMAFDVASVKQGEFVLPSFLLDGGDAFTATGGRFIANFPLVNFMMFAYKFYPSSGQRDALNSQLPDWAHSSSVRFTIEGKAPINDPTKDQFRLMMQSLLADRFKLAVHFETREGSIFVLTLVNPGKLGPKLRPHDSGAPCDVAEGAPAVTGGSDVFPALCGAFSTRVAPDGIHRQVGSRNTALPLIAHGLLQLETRHYLSSIERASLVLTISQWRCSGQASARSPGPPSFKPTPPIRLDRHFSTPCVISLD